MRTAQVIPSHRAETAERGSGGGESTCVRIDGALRHEFTDLDEIFIEPVPRTDPALRARVVNRYGSVLDNLR